MLYTKINVKGGFTIYVIKSMCVIYVRMYVLSYVTFRDFTKGDVYKTDNFEQGTLAVGPYRDRLFDRPPRLVERRGNDRRGGRFSEAGTYVCMYVQSTPFLFRLLVYYVNVF